MRFPVPEKIGDTQRFLVENLGALKQIANAHESAGIILEVVCGLNPLSVIRNADRTLENSERERISLVLRGLKLGKPLAYAIGEWYFAGRLFYVNEDVLIPRPDTEALLEVAKAFIRDCANSDARTRLRILELGVGSGALIISLALDFPKAFTFGTDISASAISVARRNAKRYNAKVRLQRGDLFSPFSRSTKFHLVISNPPYVDDATALEEDVLMHEPMGSLLVGEGKPGTYFHEKIAKDARSWLYPGGLLALEVGFNQADEVASILKNNYYENLRITRDIAGVERVVSGTWQR